MIIAHKKPAIKFSTGAWRLPAELAHSAPRQVRWNASGYTLIVALVLMVAGAIAGGMVMFVTGERSRTQLAELERGGVSTTARVVSITFTKGDSKRKVAVYEFAAGNRIYGGRVSLRKRNWADANEGGTIPVRYLPADPSRHWMVGYERTGAPVAAAVLVPIAALLGGLIGLAAMWRQRRILAEWRPAEARVVSSKKHEEAYSLEYEFRSISGAVHRRKHETSTPTPEGASITILYDRDNPRRTSLYPLSLVRTP